MKRLIGTSFLALAMFVGGIAVDQLFISQPEAVVVEDSDPVLPFESEKVAITKYDVTTKLSEIAELATYYGSYSVERSQDQSRYWVDNFKIPGTTNTIAITCEGIVKVGYNLDDIVVKVDNESEKIYITVPDASITDNYIVWDSVKVDEKNSILNPIEFSQYHELISEVEQAGLEHVESQGIYELAEDHLKRIISLSLEPFDYEIVYMN